MEIIKKFKVKYFINFLLYDFSKTITITLKKLPRIKEQQSKFYTFKKFYKIQIMIGKIIFLNINKKIPKIKLYRK